MKNPFRSKIVLIFLIIAIMGYLIFRIFFAGTKNTVYKTEAVKIGTVTQTVAANGTLNPVILVNVGTQVSGTVQKIYADYNSQVKAGQVLLELDPKLFKAALMQSMATVNKAKSNLELAKANEKRGLSLLKQGDISKQDWDTLVDTTRSAAADVDLAIATSVKDQANLDYATIISPVSGVVVERNIDVGQTVAASFQTPTLFKIAQDLSKMQIDSSFAEADIANIRPGQSVTFTVDAFPNRTFNGYVKQIRLNFTVQQNVVTYDVVVLVNNTDGVLLPGMTAYVSIKTAEHKDVLLIPNAALRFRPKKEITIKPNSKIPAGSGILYKLVNGKATALTCQLGITDGRFTEISGCDLKAGDKVVTDDSQEESASSSSSIRIRAF